MSLAGSVTPPTMRHQSRTLSRICKTFSVQVSGLLTTNILTVIVIPAAFIGSYGISKYGEWLAISAGLSWLQTLDFGLQTYIVNELSIEFHRGNLSRVRELQSVALRLSLGLIGVGFLTAILIAAVAPLPRLLHLSMTRLEASVIAVALVLQVLVGILWSQLNGMLRAFGHSPRAEVWSQLQRFFFFALTWVSIFTRAPLWIVAALPLLSFLVLTFFSLADLRRIVPEAFPKLTYWDTAIATKILRPSLWFGTFTLNQFLLFQAPILILNQVSGKSAVVAFSLARALYGIVRSLAQVIRQSVTPEITRLAGAGRSLELGRLFCGFEHITFAYCLVSSIAVLIAAPIIVPRWTHIDGLFMAPLFAALAINTVVIVAKDTRLALNQSANRHVRAAIICLASYAVFVVASIPLAARWGATAIVVAWTVAELVQLCFLIWENRNVLNDLETGPLIKLFLSAFLWIWPAVLLGQLMKPLRIASFGIAFAAGIFLMIHAFMLFGIYYMPHIRASIQNAFRSTGSAAVNARL